MVSIPGGFNDNISMTPNQYETTKNPSAINSLHQFSKELDVKHKTDVCGLVAYKVNRKAIRTGNSCGQTFQSSVVIQK